MNWIWIGFGILQFFIFGVFGCVVLLTLISACYVKGKSQSFGSGVFWGVLSLFFGYLLIKFGFSIGSCICGIIKGK